MENLDLSTFRHIVVLSGAGISAESGLKTFRDSGGLWEGHRMEDVATPEAFARHPHVVNEFYNLRRRQLLREAEPNAAHMALARYAKHFRGNFTLVTQNVDDLHERAGSESVIHMHGELRKIRCVNCGQIHCWDNDLELATPCPTCHLNHCLRPHIVWFGEIPLQMDEIERALGHCDLFVSIGTSGQVYPAAGFVRLARSQGATTVEINLKASDTSDYFEHHFLGSAGNVVPQLFRVANS